MLDADALFALAGRLRDAARARRADGADAARRRARTPARAATATRSPERGSRASPRRPSSRGAAVLLKGPDTLVADNGEPLRVVETARAPARDGRRRRRARRRRRGAVRARAATRTGACAGRGRARLRSPPGGLRGGWDRRHRPAACRSGACSREALDARDRPRRRARERAAADRRPRAAAACGPWSRPTATGMAPSSAPGTALSAGAERICCATLEEARELREGLGGRAPIVVLSPLQPGEEVEAGGSRSWCRRWRTTPGCAAPACRAPCTSRPTPAWAAGAWRLPTRSPSDASSQAGVARSGWPGVMSHLATADDDPAFAAVQAAVFAALAREFPPCARHLANSAAALTLPDTHFDAVRCGIALYGVSPFDRDPAEHGLRPALRWTSRVAGLRDLAARAVCRLRPAPDRRRAPARRLRARGLRRRLSAHRERARSTCSCAACADPSRRRSRWISSPASSPTRCSSATRWC